MGKGSRSTMKTAASASRSASVERIALVKLSLRCFGYSLAGLVPLLGIPFALAAMRHCRKASTLSADWNPAAPYLRAARRIAPLTFLISLGFLVAVWGVIPALWRDALGCASGST